jgi:hypothetical protein
MRGTETVTISNRTCTSHPGSPQARFSWWIRLRPGSDPARTAGPGQRLPDARARVVQARIAVGRRAHRVVTAISGRPQSRAAVRAPR